MPDCVGHPLQHRAVAGADEAGYSAHGAILDRRGISSEVPITALDSSFSCPCLPG
jgi:hypothetical protein